MQKPVDTEFQLSLLNEITKESLFEDLNKTGGVKRDLMRIANLIVNEIPRKKHKKTEKIEEKIVKIEQDKEML